MGLSSRTRKSGNITNLTINGRWWKLTRSFVTGTYRRHAHIKIPKKFFHKKYRRSLHSLQERTRHCFDGHLWKNKQCAKLLEYELQTNLISLIISFAPRWNDILQMHELMWCWWGERSLRHAVIHGNNFLSLENFYRGFLLNDAFVSARPVILVFEPLLNLLWKQFCREVEELLYFQLGTCRWQKNIWTHACVLKHQLRASLDIHLQILK